MRLLALSGQLFFGEIRSKAQHDLRLAALLERQNSTAKTAIIKTLIMASPYMRPLVMSYNPVPKIKNILNRSRPGQYAIVLLRPLYRKMKNLFS